MLDGDASLTFPSSSYSFWKSPEHSQLSQGSTIHAGFSSPFPKETRQCSGLRAQTGMRDGWEHLDWESPPGGIPNFAVELPNPCPTPGSGSELPLPRKKQLGIAAGIPGETGCVYVPGANSHIPPVGSSVLEKGMFIPPSPLRQLPLLANSAGILPSHFPHPWNVGGQVGASWDSGNCPPLR